MTIYLDLNKGLKLAKSRDKTLNDFDVESSRYKLIVGMPILVSVEGTYIEAKDLPSICFYRDDMLKVERWVESLKNPIPYTDVEYNFKWKR